MDSAWLPHRRLLARGLGDEGKVDEASFVLEKTVESGVWMIAEGWQSLPACFCSDSVRELKPRLENFGSFS
jgi:hypothetical protein